MGELVLQEENKDKVGTGKAGHPHVLRHIKVGAAKAGHPHVLSHIKVKIQSHLGGKT